jgi:hypothetical protein
VQLVADEPRVEPLLEQMPDTAMPRIEQLRVRRIQPLHPLRELLQVSADEQVKVIRHQAVQKARPLELTGDAPQAHEEAAAVAVVMEDRAARDSSGGDMVDACRWELGAT